MIGGDMATLDKNNKNTLSTNNSEYLTQNKTIFGNKSSGHDILIKVLFYSSREDLTTKFLKQFRTLKPQQNFPNTYGIELLSLLREYESIMYLLSLWIVKTSGLFNKYLEKLYHIGARVIIIYDDPNDTEYVFKLRELISRLKAYSDAKFLLVFDKEDQNPIFKESIKSLLDDRSIHGIYKIDLDRADNDYRLISEIIRVGAID